MMVKKYFNMLEIALAIAIIAIGATSIMALFPVGMSAGNATVADNNIPDAAETLLATIEAMVQMNWRDENGVANSSTNSFLTGLGTTPPAEPTSFDSANALGIEPSLDKRVFRFKKEIEVDGGSVTEFSAIARVWNLQMDDLFNGFSWDPSADDDEIKKEIRRNSARIYVEISWPADRDYNARDKRLYILELFNQAYSPNP